MGDENKESTYLRFIGRNDLLTTNKAYFAANYDKMRERVFLINETGLLIKVSEKDVEPLKIKEPCPFDSSGKLDSSGKGLEFGKMKQKAKATEEQITATIDDNEIYRRVRAAINAPQRHQVGYGIDKYPEPLTADTWTIIETLDHIIGETIDKLHYLTMLKIKFEKMGTNDLSEK